MVLLDARRILENPITVDAFEKVILNANIDKDPGVDGFNPDFSKACWEIIKWDVISAIKDFFFLNGHLLKQVNATSIMLVPKIQNLVTFADYRPILVCKVIYRFITKIMANKHKNILSEIIDDNQHAFIKVCLIWENSFLCQELFLHYNKNQVVPNMSIKIDIYKAYDSV